MTFDDDAYDPLLRVTRVNIPAEFAEVVIAMDATSLKHKRDKIVADPEGGTAYFDAVMSNFLAAPTREATI